MARKSQYPPSVKPGIPKKPHLPEGWYLKSFDDVVEVVERPAQLQDNQEYQLVTAKRSRGGIVPRERLLGEQILTKTQYYTNAGDFLISRRQIIHGACGLVPPELDGAVVSNEYSTLITKPDLLAEYLAYFSHTTYFQQTCFQSSVGVDVEKMIFKLDDWLKYKIPLPPLSEQRKIAEILSSLDEAIASTQAVIDQTRKVKQGLLQQLLTRGIGHTKFKESAIGKIPENWQVVSLQNMGKPNWPVIRSGPFGSSLKTEHFRSKGKPVLTIQSLGEGEIVRDGLFYVDADKAKELSEYLVETGDLVFSRVADIGRSVVITEHEKDWLISSNLMRISVNQDKYNPWFVMYSIVGGGLVTKQIEKLSGTTGRPVVSSQMMKQIAFAIPPIDEQIEIALRIQQTEEVIRQETFTVDRLVALKNGLMQDLLTGRVRVKTPN